MRRTVNVRGGECAWNSARSTSPAVSRTSGAISCTGVSVISRLTEPAAAANSLHVSGLGVSGDS